MKKTVFLCIGNVLLFILMGLAFLYPVSDLKLLGEAGFTAKVTIFPILLLAYLFLYPAAGYIFMKVCKAERRDHSELACSDEREKVIVSEAAKTSYRVMTGGMIGCIAVIGGVRFFSIYTHHEISIYFVSVLLLTVLLTVSMVSYCVRWVLEYQK